MHAADHTRIGRRREPDVAELHGSRRRCLGRTSRPRRDCRHTNHPTSVAAADTSRAALLHRWQRTHVRAAERLQCMPAPARQRSVCDTCRTPTVAHIRDRVSRLWGATTGVRQAIVAPRCNRATASTGRAGPGWRTRYRPPASPFSLCSACAGVRDFVADLAMCRHRSSMLSHFMPLSRRKICSPASARRGRFDYGFRTRRVKYLTTRTWRAGFPTSHSAALGWRSPYGGAVRFTLPIPSPYRTAICCTALAPRSVVLDNADRRAVSQGDGAVLDGGGWVFQAESCRAWWLLLHDTSLGPEAGSQPGD
jgi:hypothetical protein